MYFYYYTFIPVITYIFLFVHGWSLFFVPWTQLYSTGPEHFFTVLVLDTALQYWAWSQLYSTGPGHCFTVLVLDTALQYWSWTLLYSTGPGHFIVLAQVVTYTFVSHTWSQGLYASVHFFTGPGPGLSTGAWSGGEPLATYTFDAWQNYCSKLCDQVTGWIQVWIQTLSKLRDQV